MENQNEAAVAAQAGQMQVTKELYDNTKAFLKNLDKLEETVELTSEYFDWGSREEGEVHRFVFMGMTTLTSQFGGESQKVEAAKLMDKEGKTVIMGDAVICGSLREVQAPKCVAIAKTGEEDGKNGKYKTFSVKLLA